MSLRIAFISRSTLFTNRGGDTVQMVETARHLRLLDVWVDIYLCNEPIPYDRYDLLHFFNITRPADIWLHAKRSRKPYVLSPIFVSYAEYDQQYRKGVAGKVFRVLRSEQIEYIKTVARWLTGKEQLVSRDYLWRGQTAMIRKLLQNVSMLLPNSFSEYVRLAQRYQIEAEHNVIVNGIDTALFDRGEGPEKDPKLVICVARVEGLKNQLNLIRALNGTSYQLLIIGAASANQQNYYRQCRKEAAANVRFVGQVSQRALADYYRCAKVHVLPSWFETTGLSSLEAAAMGCQVVITDKGDTRNYFGDNAFYCDPKDPQSILAAIDLASATAPDEVFRKKIIADYTWTEAARQTLSAYFAIYEKEHA